jgi:alginate O-acetyltransferase complex protein AlgI
MVFSDLFFLFVFIPAFALCYLLATLLDSKLLASNDQRSCISRNVTLVLFSLLFYGWGEPVYLFLMILCVLLNYLSGLAIDRYAGVARKRAFILGLVANILILGLFKYAGFIATSLNSIGVPMPVPQISLPIGISFYTFQSISYLVDVYRREAVAQRHFGNLLLYISMFPQLVAGPIVRYDTIAQEIAERKTTSKDVAEGAFRFLIGLGKKVIIANQFSEVADQFLRDGLGSLSTAGAWIGAFAYALQIYFDFSGYSDMAIGIGRCMGFHFNENFNHPYCGTSITDFWRRWHISLGSFFRDYVYIPLGGNRRHQSLNIIVVWFLTGLWHGASWNFILWGLYFGLIVLVEKYTLLRIFDRIPRFVLHTYCLFFVMLSWGIFYYDDIDAMGTFYSSLFGHTEAIADISEQSALWGNFWLWVVAIIFCMPTRQFFTNMLARLCGSHSQLLAWTQLSIRLVASILIIVVSVALLVGATNNAFIYTRF